MGVLSNSPDHFLHITKGTTSAVSFLDGSKPPLIHGNIKGVCQSFDVSLNIFSLKFQSNILVSENGDALLSNFRLARLRRDLTWTLSHNNEVKQVGLVWFLAPELLHGDILKWTADSDCYTLAMTFLELVTNDYPFREISNNFKLMVAVGNGVHPQHPETLSILSQQDVNYLWSLLEAMWTQNPWECLTMPFVEHALLC
jgi:serine/threonine protein kinase